MSSLLRPLIPLLLLGPTLALMSERTQAATPLASPPVVVRTLAAKVRQAEPALRTAKARIFTVSAQSCVRSGNRMIC